MSATILAEKKKQLPDGWRWVKLGEIFNITSSKRVFESDWKWEGVPFYRAREIVKLAQQGFVENDLFISKDMFNEYSIKYGIPKAGDIMVTGVGTLGVCYVVREHDKFYFKDGNIIWFKKNSANDSVFIEYAFQTDMLREQIMNAPGATVGTFTIVKAKNTQVPLPSLAEQKRIARVLKEKFTAVDKARSATQARLEAVKALPAAFLRKVFPKQGQSLSPGWRWSKLGDVCTQDRNIVESNSREAESLTYYSLEHIESVTGEILKSDSGHVDDEGISTTFRFDKRHVLYGKLRPYLNKVALPDSAGRCTTEIIPLKPSANIDRVYLAWILRRHETVEFAMQGKTGSRMPRADMKSLFTLEIPLPLKSKQHEIIKELSVNIAIVKKATKQIEEELETINALPAALLRRAFNGEI